MRWRCGRVAGRECVDVRLAVHLMRGGGMRGRAAAVGGDVGSRRWPEVMRIAFTRV